MTEDQSLSNGFMDTPVIVIWGGGGQSPSRENVEGKWSSVKEIRKEAF